MPSILIANPYFPPFVPGGAEHSLVEFCARMSVAGWKIRVLTMAWDGDARVEECDGYIVDRVACPVTVSDALDPTAEAFVRSPDGQQVVVARVMQLLSDGARFDWILANNSQYISAAAQIKARSGLPAAVVLRDTQLMCEVAHCLDGYAAKDVTPCGGLAGQLACYARFTCERQSVAWRAWPGLMLNGAQTWRRRERFRRDVRQLTRIVTISEALATLARAVPGISSERISVIHNLATHERAASQDTVHAYLHSCGLEPGQYFLLAGRKTIGKGIDVAVETARALAGAGSQVKILAVGHGHAPGGESPLVDLPPVERSLLMGLLDNAMGTLIPGRRQEGLHRTMLDAVARKRPVVCTDSGGVPEGVINGENGYVTPCNDANALCQAIMRVSAWADPEWDLCRDASERVFALRFSDEVVRAGWQALDECMRAT